MLVAEDVTSRFLNVISLFNGFIPIVAIQLQALKVEGALTLVATRVVDQISLATEEEGEDTSVGEFLNTSLTRVAFVSTPLRASWVRNAAMPAR